MCSTTYYHISGKTKAADISCSLTYIAGLLYSIKLCHVKG